MNEPIMIKSYFANLRDCQNFISDSGMLSSMIKYHLEKAGLHVIGEAKVKDPREGTINEGVSAVEIFFPLEESHCIIHTFPQLKWAIVELSTCGHFEKSVEAFNSMIDSFKPNKVEIKWMGISPEGMSWGCNI